MALRVDGDVMLAAGDTHLDGDARMIGVRALPGRRARYSMRSAVLAVGARRCRGAAQQGGAWQAEAGEFLLPSSTRQKAIPVKHD
jgi:hypothetical protein